MNVHLIRSKNVTNDLYYGVIEYLQHITGPVNFLSEKERREITINDEMRMLLPEDPEFHIKSINMVKESSPMYFNPIKTISWSDLFNTCHQYRIKKGIPQDDIVILLTEYGNHSNWFIGYDEEQVNNYFVHVENWEHYLENDARYPIAYLIATLLLKTKLFSTPKELMANFHSVSKGCIMDFCRDKTEITLKMRTADICRNCQQLIAERSIPFALTRYTIEMMEDIRKMLLFRERFAVLRTALPLVIKGYMRKLYIPDLGNLQINLSPMERSIYLLFINHPEGIRLAEMSDHKEELKSILNIVSRNSDLAVINSGVDELCAYNSNSLSEKISRIRRKFRDLLGDEMAEHYIIKGPNGEIKKIELDRALVKEEN